jgi:hypothetical protein
VCTAGGAVAGSMRGRDPGLWMVREVGARRPWSSMHLVLHPASDILDHSGAGLETVHPRDECDTAGVCCGH